MRILQLLFLSLWANLFMINIVTAQSNPAISVLPGNSGLVAVGATLDLQIDIGNTGTVGIPQAKLRPIVQVPPSVVFLSNAEQTGLPAGWTILSNTGSQLRICNTSFIVPPQSSTTIFLKVRGLNIAPPQTFNGQIAFGNGTTCANGTSVAGNNTADDIASSTIEVVAGCNLGINASAAAILCNNGTTTITATATNNTGPVEYSINGAQPFQSSNVFTNIPAGNYTVTAREVNNPSTCIISTSINITQPPVIPAPIVNITQPSCSSANAVVLLTNSNIGLDYSVDAGPFSTYPTGGYLLSSGPHTIVARDANLCTSTITTFTVNTQPVTPATPTIGSITQPDCNNSVGSVQLNGLPTGAWTITPGNITGNTASTVINNLAAGTYSFSVTNVDGCTSLPTTDVIINGVVGAPEAPVIQVIQPTCSSSTGSISITSATSGLTFSLDNAPFAPYPAGGYAGIMAGTHSIIAQNVSGCLSPFTNFIVQNQPASPAAPTVLVQQPTCTVSTGNIIVTSATNGFTFSLDAGPFVSYPTGGFLTTPGTHSLAVQNLSGCAPNITENIIVNAQPSRPMLSANFTPITCFNGNSSITAIASGGISPYEFNINGGIFQNQNTFTVVSGNYNITVRDANGCIGSSNIIISQPTAISATAVAGTIACNGDSTSITVTANGGLGSYEYNINNGPYQPSNIFNVSAGSYNVNVRLINNPSCSTSTNTTINVTQPNVLRANAVANAIVACGGNTIAKVSAIGGTAPYTGIGDFVRGPGNYNFIVTDARGCTSDTNLFIFPPGCVDIHIFPNPAQDIIKVNHTAAVGTNAYLQIFSENGVRMLSYNIPQNNFISSFNISALASGTYIMVYINGDEKKSTRFIKSNK